MAAASKSFSGKLEIGEETLLPDFSGDYHFCSAFECLVFFYLARLKMYAIKERGERDSILIVHEEGWFS